MSSLTTGFGLRAVFHPSGVLRPRVIDLPIDRVSGSPILGRGTVVSISGTNSWAVAASGAPGNGSNAVIAGIEYTDANGARQKAAWVNTGNIPSGQTLRVAIYEADTEFEALAIGSVSDSVPGSVYDLAGNATTYPANPVPTYSEVTSGATVATGTAGTTVLVTDFSKLISPVPVNSLTPGGGEDLPAVGVALTNPVLRVKLAKPYSGATIAQRT